MASEEQGKTVVRNPMDTLKGIGDMGLPLLVVGFSYGTQALLVLGNPDLSFFSFSFVFSVFSGLFSFFAWKVVLVFYAWCFLSLKVNIPSTNTF